MRTIQIGLEVHKAIEAERRTLAETENAVLMRLLLGESNAPKIEVPQQALRTGKAWTKDDVVLPEGTKLKGQYSGQTVVGEVIDGRWLIAGKSYDSPSMALIHNVRTRDGRRTNINGWNHWLVQRPQDTVFKSIKVLRGR